MTTLRSPGFLQRKSLHQDAELLPIHPALLTSPAQPLFQQTTGLMEVGVQAPGVSDHPVVIIVPTKLGVQCPDQLTSRQVPMGLEPATRSTRQRGPKPLARRPVGQSTWNPHRDYPTWPNGPADSSPGHLRPEADALGQSAP